MVNIKKVFVVRRYGCTTNDYSLVCVADTRQEAIEFLKYTLVEEFLGILSEENEVTIYNNYRIEEVPYYSSENGQ
jgi:septin family protein